MLLLGAASAVIGMLIAILVVVVSLVSRVNEGEKDKDQLRSSLGQSQAAVDALAKQVEALGATPVVTPGPALVEGPAGPQGLTGLQGIQGPAGSAGAAGQPGLTGAQGIQGPAGPVGPRGEPGPAGSPGAQGPAGEDGADGRDGTDGKDGADGESPKSFTWTQGGKTWTCSDPDRDGSYTCTSSK
jgi:hypothetical protein